MRISVRTLVQPQALVSDILPTTTVINDYVIGLTVLPFYLKYFYISDMRLLLQLLSK